MKKRIYLLLMLVLPVLCMAVSFSDTKIDYTGTMRYRGRQVIGKITAPDTTVNYTWTDYEGDTSPHLGIKWPHIKDTAHAPKVPGVYFENYADGDALWFWDGTAKIFRKAGLPSYSDTTAAPKVSNTYIIDLADSGRLYRYAYGKWRKAGL